MLGAAGDMLLGALLDAGAPLPPVEAAVRACGLDVTLALEEVQRAGLSARRLVISGPDAMADSPERTLSACLEAVAAAPEEALPPPAGRDAERVLRRIGEVEASLHGVAAADVHLHELSAADTLVDVVGVCTALHLLGVERITCSPLPGGSGTVATRHGVLPLPAPATLRLLADAAAPLLDAAPGAELVTPTAAALLTTLASFEPPRLRLRAVGVGAGSRDDPGHPNVSRCWLGDALGGDAQGLDGDRCVELRTNLDDVAPTVVAHLAARCLEAGALDAWVVPATMKKGRPGHVLHALVPAGAEDAVAGMLLAESPTLGVRMSPASRLVAARDSVTVQTPLGPARVKRKRLHGTVVDVRPEADDCVRLAREHGRPLQEVIDMVVRHAEEVR